MIEILEEQYTNKKNLSDCLLDLVLSNYTSEGQRAKQLKTALAKAKAKIKFIKNKKAVLTKENKELKKKIMETENSIAKNVEIINRDI